MNIDLEHGLAEQPRKKADRIVFSTFAIGALLNAWLLFRSGYGADQIALLDLGLSLPDGLTPTAKAMSGGARIPGSLLQLLIGLPLLLWENVNSPKILIWTFNLTSGFVLWNAVKRLFVRDNAVAVFILYWLSPWRIYHASLIWEPAFLFLPASLHFFACSKLGVQNDRHSFGPSLLLGAILTLTPQLHGSFIALWLLTIGLILRKKVSIRWPAFALGVCVGAITLIPFGVSMFNGFALSLSPTDGYIGKGLITVAPMLKGILYWVRLGSLDIGVPLKEAVFPGLSVLVLLLQIVGVAGIVLAVCASYSMIRSKIEKSSFPKYYAIAGFVAIVLSAALSPITLQGWHVIILLHAAVIPVGAYLYTGPERIRNNRRGILTAYSLLSVLILIVMGLGKPTFNGEPLPKEAIENPRVEKLLTAP